MPDRHQVRDVTDHSTTDVGDTMQTAASTHPPVLHDTYHPREATCTYTGPDDDQECPGKPRHHVVFVNKRGGEWHGLRACMKHVVRAVEVAMQESLDQWWAHRLGDDCLTDGALYVTDAYCVVDEEASDG